MSVVFHVPAGTGLGGRCYAICRNFIEGHTPRFPVKRAGEGARGGARRAPDCHTPRVIRGRRGPAALRRLVTGAAVAALLTVGAGAASAEPVQQFGIQLKDVTADGRYSVVYTSNAFDTTGDAPPALSEASLRLAAGMAIKKEFLRPDRLCDITEVRPVPPPEAAEGDHVRAGDRRLPEDGHPHRAAARDAGAPDRVHVSHHVPRPRHGRHRRPAARPGHPGPEGVLAVGPAPREVLPVPGKADRQGRDRRDRGARALRHVVADRRERTVVHGAAADLHAERLRRPDARRPVRLPDQPADRAHLRLPLQHRRAARRERRPRREDRRAGRATSGPPRRAAPRPGRCRSGPTTATSPACRPAPWSRWPARASSPEGLGLPGKQQYPQGESNPRYQRERLAC